MTSRIYPSVDRHYPGSDIVSISSIHVPGRPPLAYSNRIPVPLTYAIEAAANAGANFLTLKIRTNAGEEIESPFPIKELLNT